ncbi:MAG: hypothetical protein ABFC96_09655 [Thermoguttaceae bacterium]
MFRRVVVISGIAAAIVAMVCLSTSARSDNAASDNSAPFDEMKKTCEEIVTLFSRGDPKVYELLNEHMASPPPSDVDQAAKNVLQLKSLLALQDRFGAYLGCEVAKEKHANQMLCEYDFVAKYEKNVVVWTCMLYRPHDKWKILACVFRADSGAVSSVLN